jgi:hypothetical protein
LVSAANTKMYTMSLGIWRYWCADISLQTVSTLSFLEPFRRAPVGIPFLYQKVPYYRRRYIDKSLNVVYIGHIYQPDNRSDIYQVVHIFHCHSAP